MDLDGMSRQPIKAALCLGAKELTQAVSTERLKLGNSQA